MSHNQWIVAPFWWTEKTGILRHAAQKMEVSHFEIELVKHWRHPRTDADVAAALGVGESVVAAARARLTKSGLIVSVEDAKLAIPAVEIEITSLCNANCVMCPRDTLLKHRGYANMREEVFDAIIKNIGGRGVPAYYLCGIGEALLHPNWRQFANRLREADANAGIICVTNGFNIKAQELDSIIDSPIDVLEVSLHSLDEDMHHSIMRSFAVSRALERVDALLECLAQRNDRSLQIRIGQVLVASHPKPELDLAAWAHARNLDFNAWRSWNRAGHVPESVLVDSPDEPRDFQGSNRSPGICADYANLLFIDHEGEILSCCCDIANETTEFNITRHTFEEIIDGRHRRLASGLPLSPICDRCDAPATNKFFCVTDYFRVATL